MSSTGGVATPARLVVGDLPAARVRLTRLEWAVCAIACIGFAFDTYEFVVTSLIEKLFDAARRHGAKSVGVSGGVSANSRLRAELQDRGARREMPTFLPSLQLSTDNAAMIAAAGLRKFRAGVTSPLDLNADAALALG